MVQNWQFYLLPPKNVKVYLLCHDTELSLRMIRRGELMSKVKNTSNGLSSKHVIGKDHVCSCGFTT